MQTIRNKFARLRFFAVRSGLSLALALALGACKPAPEAEIVAPTIEAGPSGLLDWSAS